MNKDKWRKAITPKERVAINFLQKYGEDALKRMIDQFSDGTSHKVIADELGVSRERVRQWRRLMGTTITIYNVHPEVRRYLP